MHLLELSEFNCLMDLLPIGLILHQSIAKLWLNCLKTKGYYLLYQLCNETKEKMHTQLSQHTPQLLKKLKIY